MEKKQTFVCRGESFQGAYCIVPQLAHDDSAKLFHYWIKLITLKLYNTETQPVNNQENITLGWPIEIKSKLNTFFTQGTHWWM